VFLPSVKLAVRSAEIAACEALWESVKSLGDGNAVREVLRGNAKQP
jgi:hypothetical protein